MARLRGSRLRSRLVASTWNNRAVPSTERQREQLLLLNRRWCSAVEHVRYYRELRDSRSVPARFESLEQFAATAPIIDRTDLRWDTARFVDQRRKHDWLRVTGGSTGEPLQLPAWRQERWRTTIGAWTARGWIGIGPSDRLLLVWGHSHVLGSGIPGRINALKRALNDHLLGYARISAYDLDERNLARAGDVLLRHRPQWVYGYSGAIDALARANRGRAEAFAELKLNAVVTTAEPLPRADSRSVIEHVFGARLRMEYGAAETGVIGVEEAADDYRLLWNDHLVEVLDGEDRGDVVVTSLFERATPLFRYRLGDRAAVPNGSVGTARDRILRIEGRDSGLLDLGQLGAVHALAFKHAVEQEPSVLGYQVVIGRGVEVRIVVDAQEREAISRISARLARANPALAAVTVVAVPALITTSAGKAPVIVRMPGSPKAEHGSSVHPAD